MNRYYNSDSNIQRMVAPLKKHNQDFIGDRLQEHVQVNCSDIRSDGQLAVATDRIRYSSMFQSHPSQ